MRRSLQRRLSLMLGGAILLAGLVAALASFLLAFAEAREFQDDMLRQIAVLAEGGAGDAASADTARRSLAALADPESRVRVLRLPGDARPAWLAADISAGFHTLDADGGRLRVFVRRQTPARATVVAQPTDTRDELATNSALRTLLPLLLLLPLMAWLVVRIVRAELAPVQRLAADLDAQPAHRPRPLSDAGVPDEITPFVHGINRLLERIAELMGQQRRFIADAAHELRSPLTALSVQAQNLRHADSPDAMRERVLPLQAGIERARKLTEQLLSLARTQAGQMAASDVDVSAMARELIAEFLPAAGQRNIDLGLDEVAPLTLRATPDTLRLILRNALENALKYAPLGGEVTLRLCPARAGEPHAGPDGDVIEIIDDGPGIPPAERARVFDPFHRLPGAAAEGSGLGLAIAREAAAALGGTVSLHHRTGGSGLVFRYHQPRME